MSSTENFKSLAEMAAEVDAPAAPVAGAASVAGGSSSSSAPSAELLEWFRDPSNYKTSYYSVRDSGGDSAQAAPEREKRDMAWETERAEIAKKAEQLMHSKHLESDLLTKKDLPAELQTRFKANVPDDHYAAQAKTWVIMKSSDLSRIPICGDKVEMFPGRRFPRMKKKGKKPTLAEVRAATVKKIEIMRKRGEKHKITEEQKKKKFLDLQPVEIFYKNKDTGGWCSAQVHLAATEEKTGRPKSFLRTSTTLSEKMGLKVGSIFVLERFRRTTTKVYVLTVLGFVDVLDKPTMYKKRKKARAARKA